MIREIITQKSKMTKLSVTNNRISAILRAENEKTGLRVYQDGLIGVAGAIGKYDEDELTARAKHMLRYRVPYDCAPTERAVRTVDLSQRFALTDEELVSTSTRLLDELRRRYPAFTFSHIIRYEEKEESLRNDVGADLLYRDKYVSLELLIKYKSSKSLMDGFAVNISRMYSFDDAFAIASEYCDAYEETIELPREGKIPVVLLTEHMFLNKFLTDLNGKQYGAGTSLFAGRAGEKLFHERFSLEVDRNPETCYGGFFDGEGTTLPGDRCLLIENGVLRMPYTTKRIAKKYGLPLTASASLSYDAVPDATPEGIRATPGDQTLHALLGGRKAIFVMFASGGDFTAQGEYASPVQAAYLFDENQIYGRLPQLAMSSNVFDMFGKDFVGVSCDSNSPHSPFRYLVVDMDVKKIGGHM